MADATAPSPGRTRGRPWSGKQRLRCLFCGAARCRRCSGHAAGIGRAAALSGLHSSWVDESLLAMMRPSSRVFREHALAQQLQDAGVVAVVNLCQPGEHPFCGDGNRPASGFPYDPEEDLMRHGIQYLNFGWPDMRTPSLGLALAVVQAVAGLLERGGKVAIHCHAGFGRTGVVAACVLVFARGMEPAEAVAQVRERRPGSVQTARQVEFVDAFAAMVADRGVRFPTQGETLERLLELQRIRLHGAPLRALGRLPQVLLELRDRLVALPPDGLAAAVAGAAAARPSGDDRDALDTVVDRANTLGAEPAIALGDGGGRRDDALAAALLLRFLGQLGEPLIPAETTLDVAHLRQLPPARRDCVLALLAVVRRCAEAGADARDAACKALHAAAVGRAFELQQALSPGDEPVLLALARDEWAVQGPVGALQLPRVG